MARSTPPGSVSPEPWLAEGEEKRAQVRRMFGEIAPTYDRLNGLLSFNRHHRWRQAAVDSLGLKAGESALDVCCGTGDFLIPLRRAVGETGRVEGLDFCAPMLEIAAKKPGHQANLLLGDACSLPHDSERFDAVTVGWGLRNVPDLAAALAEAHRVLRPGGRIACLDMTRPTGPLGRLGSWAFHRFSPLLGRIFGRAEAYEYLPKSTERFLTARELAEAFQASGFTEVRVKLFMFGNIALHTARRGGNS